MSEYDKLDAPFLTKRDEEYRMLIDVTQEYPNQTGSPSQKSGKATQTVVRKHLKSHNLNVSKNNVSVEHSKKMHLLILKKGIPSNEEDYSRNQVHVVLDIRNNAVYDKNVIIGNKFNEIENQTKVSRFAVIVLSERLSSPYKHVITKEDIGKENCEVFTLVARKRRAHKLYLKETVVEMRQKKEMKKTGKWEKLIAYLKGK